MDRTDELLARIEALAATVAAQGAELARLRGQRGEQPATMPAAGRGAAPGRRAALRRLALGAGAAIGLLAAAREPRPAHALFEGQHVSTADNPPWGIAAYPSSVTNSQPPPGVVAGVFGLVGTVNTLTHAGASGVIGLGGGDRIGVQGVSANSFGVLGRSGTSVGVEGVAADVPTGTGGTGVVGFGGGGVAPGRGVFGLGGSKYPGVGPGGIGVEGVGGTGVSGGPTGVGVSGFSSAGTGVQGSSGGNFTQGVLGVGTGNAHGVTGTSVNAFGLSGTSTNAKGFVGVNTNGNDYAGLFVGHGANPNNLNAPGIFVKGRAVITGGVSATAVTSQGARLLHGIQAADDLAEDVGKGQLQGGHARVGLDPLFAETIKAHDYHVFLTPLSPESRGLCAAAKDGRGFEVRELGGGTGSYGFDWRVVAERKGAPPGSRLMRAADPDVRGALEKLPLHSGAPGSPPGHRPAEPPDRPGPAPPGLPRTPAPSGPGGPRR